MLLAVAVSVVVVVVTVAVVTVGGVDGRPFHSMNEEIELSVDRSDTVDVDDADDGSAP